MNSKKLIELIATNKNLAKLLFWLVAIILLFMLLSLSILLYHRAKSRSDLKIDFTKGGAAIILNDNKQVAAQFLLPASEVWVNTGIRLKPNSIIEFTASGKVHLAAHRLMEAAINDTLPLFDWCSPAGVPYRTKRSLDVLRREFLIDHKAPMGVIIGHFQKDGTPNPSVHNQRPDSLFTIYEQTEVRVPNYPVTLWLTINDVLLDPSRIEEGKAAYCGPEAKPELEKNWDYIVSHDYWDIWYDDNIGTYLIQLKTRED